MEREKNGNLLDVNSYDNDNKTQDFTNGNGTPWGYTRVLYFTWHCNVLGKK